MLIKSRGLSTITQLVIFLLIIFGGTKSGLSQTDYNQCSSAFPLCPNETYSLNNSGANITFCPNCEDDFNFCFAPNNSIWCTFNTNTSGGDCAVDFSNLLFNNEPGRDTQLQATIIQAGVPCDASSYTQIGNCVSNATGNFSLNAVGLPSNTTYYIVISGDLNGVGITLPAEASFDVSISGTGVDRPISNAILNGPATTVCPKDTVTFTTSLTDCPDNGDFNWFINGQFVAATTTNSYTTNVLTNGDIVTVSTSCYADCPDTVSAQFGPVSVYDLYVDAGDDFLIGLGESVQLFGSSNGIIYSWEPSFLVSNPTILTPITSPTQTTVFELTAEDSNGCKLTDYVTVSLDDSLVIPTTFTPNNDDINETWVIKGIENFPNNTVKIYSRWGQQVFQAINYSKLKAWDGTNNSELLEGVYFYVIDLEGDGETIYKGTVTVLR